MDIEKRVAIITSATGKLGRIVAKKFVERGARLILVSLSKSKLQQLG